MNMYEVTGRDGNGCKVKHVIKAESGAQALEKFHRAYPVRPFPNDANETHVVILSRGDEA